MTGKAIVKHISDHCLWNIGVSFPNNGFATGIRAIQYICDNDLFDVEVTDARIEPYTDKYKFVTLNDVYQRIGIGTKFENPYTWSVPIDYDISTVCNF